MKVAPEREHQGKKRRLECPPKFNTKKPISLDEEALLLDGRRLPARLTSAEVAVVLGFQEHDIDQLVVSKLLIPLEASPQLPEVLGCRRDYQCRTKTANGPPWLSSKSPATGRAGMRRRG